MKLILRLTFMLVLMPGFLPAQVERVLPRKGSSSLEGTQFVVGFMQNEILGWGAVPRLQIFIATQYDANIRIDYPVFGPVYKFIPANTIYVEDVYYTLMVTQSEVPQAQGIFITSDAPIVVYALNTILHSTDTYSAIPIKHLGTDYFTINKPNDHYRLDTNQNPLDTAIRNSEFMILAVEDFTEVSVVPTVRTVAGNPAGVPFTVKLNKGEVFLVKSGWTLINAGDLTGSRVQSTKPIALLSGHMRAGVPTYDLNFKDHLVEMLFPINKWGNTHVTTPFALVDRPEYVRVIASTPNTTVEIVTRSGTQTSFFSAAGDWKEYTVTDVALWRSDNPVSIAQFMPSSNGAVTMFDPAMVIVPPLEVYVEAALFQFPILESTGVPDQEFYYFINVVCEQKALSTLQINGRLVSNITPRILTQTVPGTTLRWAQVPLAPGVYSMSADSGLFSGVMYSTSGADSYANLFGVRFDSIPRDDESPPVYGLDVVCGKITGYVSDVSNDTALLTEVTVITNRTYNYWWAISEPTDVIGTVDVVADIRDRWADAQIVIHAYDYKGNGREWLYYYDAPFMEVPPVVTINATDNNQVCYDVPIVNKDSTPVSISSIVLNGDARITIRGQPITNVVIAPADTLRVTVCYQPSGDSNQARSELIVTYPCDLVAKIQIRSATLASLSTLDHDFGNVRIGDTSCASIPIFNNGSKAVRIDSLIRGAGSEWYQIVNYSPELPYTLAPGDSIWVKICFSPDSLGAAARTDTVDSDIGAFVTTSLKGRGVRPQIRDVIIDFGRRRVGTATDTVVKIFNVGEADAYVQSGPPLVNEPSFIFPQPGLPTTIAPLDFSMLRVQFNPTARGTFTDTVPMIVDWRYHEPVRITVAGKGVLPEITTHDVDFGNVIVGQFKDTTAAIVESGGNEALTVFSVTALGPDASAFSVPQNVVAMSVVDVAATVSDSIRFTPARIGQHTSVYEIKTNAAPGNTQATSNFRLLGNGIPEPYLEFNGSLIVPTTIMACTDTPIEIVLNNPGTLPVTVDTILVAVGTRAFTVSPVFPLLVSPGSRVSVPAMINVDRTLDVELIATVFYNQSLSIVLRQGFGVAYDKPTVTSAAVIDGAPGNVGSIEVSVAATTPKVVSEPFVIRMTVPKQKWAVSPDIIRATVSDAISTGEQDLVPAIVNDGAEFTLAREVQAPYQIRFAVTGSILWSDPSDTPIEFLLLETVCSDIGESVSRLSLALCGGKLRMVRFDTPAEVTASLRSHPIGRTLPMQFIATKNTYVSLELFTLSGERFLLVDNYPLEKGITDVNFSVSDWTSGIYSLRVKHSAGEGIIPFVLVK